MKHLTPEQHRQLLDMAKADPANGLLKLLSILAVTGMRCEELARLRTNDINAKTGAISIKAAKNSNNRQLLLPKWLLDSILNVGPTAQRSASLMVALHFNFIECADNVKDRHNAKQYLRDQWRIFRKQLGADKIPLHGLRHSVAMRMIEDNDNIRRIASVLGHKNINNTMKYLDHQDSLQVSKDLLKLVGAD